MRTAPRWLVLPLLTLMMSCSILVDPGGDEVRCIAQSGAVDPCGEVGAGLVCREGKCEACIPGTVQEDCDRVDNDCDGRIDEGNDQDGDGFTWCGGGIRTLADCVDTDATIRPAGDTLDGVPMHRDTCGDGVDNDCSGVPDDDPSCDGTANCEDIDTPCPTPGLCTACPAQQQCELCPMGLNCGARLSICVTPQNPGSSCGSDADCLDSVCVPNDALGLRGNEGNVCSRACCTDSDCGADNVCVVRGNGTRLCAPVGLLGRATTRQEAPCTNDTDCTSGVCDSVAGGEPICRRMCTEDQDCLGAAHGTACVFESRGIGGGFVCGDAMTDGLTYGQVCVPSANRCASRLCVASPIYLGACGQSCRSQCDAELGQVCSYEAINLLLPELSRTPVCILTEGTAALGASCQGSQDCAQGRCANGRCSLACCNDTDCPGERCRPISTADGYGMYCAP